MRAVLAAARPLRRARLRFHQRLPLHVPCSLPTQSCTRQLRGSAACTTRRAGSDRAAPSRPSSSSACQPGHKRLLGAAAGPGSLGEKRCTRLASSALDEHSGHVMVENAGRRQRLSRRARGAQTHREGAERWHEAGQASVRQAVGPQPQLPQARRPARPDRIPSPDAPRA